MQTYLWHSRFVFMFHGLCTACWKYRTWMEDEEKMNGRLWRDPHAHIFRATDKLRITWARCVWQTFARKLSSWEIVYRSKKLRGIQSNNNFKANRRDLYYFCRLNHFQCIVSFIAMKNRISIFALNAVTFAILSPCEGLISPTKNQFSHIQLYRRCAREYIILLVKNQNWWRHLKFRGMM